MEYKFFYNGMFSNFFTCKIKYKGKEFRNSEQAFMWCKAMFFNDTQTAQEILETTTPWDAKALGRKVKPYDNAKWDAVRFDYMYEVCLAKFSQNERLKKELLLYENYVEASPTDKIWGIGLAEYDLRIDDPKNWQGLNLLGKVLDKVRIELMK